MIVAPGPGRCTCPRSTGSLHTEDTGMKDARILNLAGTPVGNAAGMRRPERNLHRGMPVSVLCSDLASSLETHRDRQLDADAVVVCTARNRSIP